MSNVMQKYIFNLNNKKNSIILHQNIYALVQMRFSNNLLYIFVSVSLLFLLSGTNNSHAQSLVFRNTPKYEVRAVWLTTIGGLDWPHNYAQSIGSVEKQKNELVKILDKLKAANINTVLLQTRIRGTVIYPSGIEPWDGCMSGIPGVSPGYDPLAFAIEECHKRGMEIHAWVVTIPVGKWNGLGCRNIRNKYPSLVVKKGSDGYINPAATVAASYIAGICREITEKYDIDGIHLDYIRYPETWRPNISQNAARDNITAIVRTVNRKIKQIKPWVKLSCSPIGKFDDLGRFSSNGWNAYGKGCQDAQKWLELGLVDQLYPMMYFRGNQFYPFALDWLENSFGRTIVPGLGIYFLSPSEADWPLEEIRRQMYFLRANNMGYAFFRNKYLCDDIKGVYSFAKEEFNLFPALVPPMSWACNVKPKGPKAIKVMADGGYTTVCWKNVDDIPQGGLMYNVYSSRTFPVDVNDVRNLLAQKQRDNKLVVKNENNLFYAVTSINRYGNESEPTQQEYVNNKSLSYANVFIKTDGDYMIVPEKGNVLDAEYLLVKDLKGQDIMTLPYKGKYADIRKLNDGQYMVYSLGRKGRTHRLGFLFVYRNNSGS